MSKVRLPGELALLAVLFLATAPVAQQLDVPAGNPITEDKINLGKALFWDEQLSSTKTVACGTCHILEDAGEDPRVLQADSIHPGFDGVFGTADDVRGSIGVVGNDASGGFQPVAHFGISPQVTTRKANSVINAAFHSRNMFWDGRAGAVFVDPDTGQVLLEDHASLENQVLEPPLSDVEMGHFNRSWPEVLTRIQQSQPLALATDIPPELAAWIGGRPYDVLFEQAFESPGVTTARVAMAIATYMRILIADQTPFHRWQNGETELLSPEENHGRQVYAGVARCDTCHNRRMAGGFGAILFANPGVRPPHEDRGRGAITKNAADDGFFKVPSLINVGLRKAFFHNGGMTDLAEVIEFYDRGGDFAENRSPEIVPLGMTAEQKTNLLAFLTNAFTDPRVAGRLPPFDRPTLYTETLRAPAAYGAGTPGTRGFAPRLQTRQPPLLGNPSWVVGFDSAPVGAPGLLFVGSTAQNPGITVAGATLLVAPGTLVVSPLPPLLPNTVAGGQGSVGFVLPSNPAFAGASLFLQAAFIDAGGPQGLSATAGLQATLFAPQ